MTDTRMVHVPFHGLVLPAIIDDQGEAWLPLKPMCEGLGVDVTAQAKRLKRESSWAVTAIMAATGADGKCYRMLAMSRATFPLWVATIEDSRVKASARPLLGRLKSDFAKKLDEYVFGREERGDDAHPRPEEFHYHSRAELRDLTVDQVAALKKTIAVAAHAAGCHVQAIYGAIRRECQVLSYLRVPQYKLERVHQLIANIRDSRYRVRAKSLPLGDPRQMPLFAPPRNGLRRVK